MIIASLKENDLIKCQNPQSIFAEDQQEREGWQLILNIPNELVLIETLKRVRAKIAPKVNVLNIRYLIYIPNLVTFINDKIRDVILRFLEDTKITIIY